MRLTVSKIDETLFSGDADSVHVPGVGGEMTVLSHHMPLIATLRQGEVVVKAGDEIFRYPLMEGFIDVGTEETRVLLS